jgi:hypothetical protein
MLRKLLLFTEKWQWYIATRVNASNACSLLLMIWILLASARKASYQHIL